MILLIDNYDSFTFNLTDYLHRLGAETKVVLNDEMTPDELELLNFDRILISPGPNTPSESGYLMDIVQRFHNRLPMLGVCLGHQAIGQFFGARLCHAPVPMHGKTSVLIHDGKGLYKGLPGQFNVCRYHSLVIEGLDGTPLTETARTADGVCMGFSHRHLPLNGVQFHPEAILTEYGLELLGNWLSSDLLHGA